MSIPTRLTERLAKLGRPETRDLVIERDVPIRMPDRAVLLADRHSPRGRGRRPTILVRSPYGRRGMFGMLFGPVFAERGFNVLIQSCRGTSGPQPTASSRATGYGYRSPGVHARSTPAIRGAANR